MLDLLYLIPLLPVAALVVNLAIGDRIGERGVSVVACGGVIGAFLVAAGAFWELLRLPPESRHVVQSLWTWMAAGSFRLAPAAPTRAAGVPRRQAAPGDIPARSGTPRLDHLGLM